jgi:hypothetical protein
MVSVGGGKSSSSSSSKPKSMVQKDIQPLRRDVGNYFRGLLREQGAGFGTTAMGPAGSAYTALLSKDPADDYLGAKDAIMSALGEDAFQRSLESAYGALLPTAQRNIQTMNQGVLQKNAGLGLRFSSDVMNQQRQGAGDILNNALAQAAGLANQQTAQQLQGGLGIMDFAQQAGESQLARQLPLLLQYATQFAPVGTKGSSGSSGWNANVGFGNMFSSGG